MDKAPLESYSDVGGLDKQIQEVKEAVELPLSHPELYDEMGIRPPKGVIFYGPPGTGKTLLAKVIISLRLPSLAITTITITINATTSTITTITITITITTTIITTTTLTITVAQAVANETSATFLRVVGSELIQKYLGDGPKLVRELFRVAEENAPSIVFMDEIDAVGVKR